MVKSRVIFNSILQLTSSQLYSMINEFQKHSQNSDERTWDDNLLWSLLQSEQF